MTLDVMQQQGQKLTALPGDPVTGNVDLEGYFCIQTDEFECSCRNKPWRYIHFEKKVIVWPNKDDESILHTAQEFKNLGVNPRIIEYKTMMGKAVEWDDIPAGSSIV